MLGLTAVGWVVLIPAVACWPVAGFACWWIWRWSKRHEEADAAERQRLLEAARAAPPAGPPRG